MSNIKKPLVTVITILAGIGLILTIMVFIMEINGFKGFAAIYYGPAVFFTAVVFAIIGTAIVHEIKRAIYVHRAKKYRKEIAE